MSERFRQGFIAPCESMEDLQAALDEKTKKLETIINGIAEDNLDVVNDLLRALKKDIAGLKAELARVKAEEAPRAALDPKTVAQEAAHALWGLNDVLAEGAIEDRRKVIDYFVESIKVNGVEGWVEAAFFERPHLPASFGLVPESQSSATGPECSFCMVPPTGFEPVLRM